MLKIDFVIPLFNEQETLESFHQMLEATKLPEGYSRRYLYINDGSTDKTQSILRKLAEGDSRMVVLEFSRNFGHQAALSAGLDAASGDVVIMMDGDGQHPPSLLPEMLRLHEGGWTKHDRADCSNDSRAAPFTSCFAPLVKLSWSKEPRTSVSSLAAPWRRCVSCRNIIGSFAA